MCCCYSCLSRFCLLWCTTLLKALSAHYETCNVRVRCHDNSCGHFLKLCSLPLSCVLSWAEITHALLTLTSHLTLESTLTVCILKAFSGHFKRAFDLTWVLDFINQVSHTGLALVLWEKRKGVPYFGLHDHVESQKRASIFERSNVYSAWSFSWLFGQCR